MVRASSAAVLPTSSTRTPAPTLTADDADALRADLTASGWGVDTVAELLGPVADAALGREIRLPALRAVRARLDADRAALRA